MRGPIETSTSLRATTPLCGSLKPREMRGPIETDLLSMLMDFGDEVSQAARNARPY